jgi:hypothetical protein
MNLRNKTQVIGAGSAGVVVAALIAATPAAAQPISFVPCSVPALSAAITAANHSGGGDLLLAVGCTYTLTTAASGEDGLPQITTPITITGFGDTITRSSSAPAFRIFDVAEGGELTLSALTVSGGRPTGEGGGILNDGKLTLSTTAVRANRAGGQGGGIANNGMLDVNASRVSFNSAVGGGGGIANGDVGIAKLRGGSVDGNTVTGDDARGGGILDNGGTVSADLMSIGSNSVTGAGSSGAGLATLGGLVTLNSSTVESNHAATSPGGILNDGGIVTLALTPVFANTPTNCADSPDPVPGCFN